MPEIVARILDVAIGGLLLGGIYALERLAKESEDFHWTVVETLAAFIRQFAPIVEEDFSEANRDLWGRTSEFSYVDELLSVGVLQLEDKTDPAGDYAVYDKAGPGHTFPINGLFAATNFSLQFDFSLKGAMFSDDLIGVHFRSPYDSNNAYDQNVGYAFNISRVGYWTLRKDNNTSLISEGQYTAMTSSYYHTLLLIVQDQYLAISINDEVIYETDALEPLEASGRFTEIAAFGPNDTSGPVSGSTFKFDNIKFWNLDGVEFDAQETSVDSMTMVYVPAGEFEMGDGQAVTWAMDFLKQKHDKPFFLAVGLF